MPRKNLPDYERCNYTTPAGRRCCKGRMTDSVWLCYYHFTAQEEKNKRDAARALQREAQSKVAELLFRERLDSVDSVTRFLARLARRVADGKLEPRIGSSLAYIGQVILTSTLHGDRQRAQAAAAAAEAAEAEANSAHPLLRKIDHIDEILKSIEQHTNPASSHGPSHRSAPPQSPASEVTS